MSETLLSEEDFVEEVKATCDCKNAVVEEGSKSQDDVRLIRFIGVTDEESNKHRFPLKVMHQMVEDAKKRMVLPFHPNSISEINPADLNRYEAMAKEQGMAVDPIPMRDMHHTKFQGTKMGRVLSLAVKYAPFVDKTTGKMRNKAYIDVVAEVFDEKAIKLLDRGMASKYSIGFKHKYDVVDGVKVSNYSVVDHWGVVDVPADPDALLLEAKEQKPKAVSYKECLHAKIMAGMSQEEAEDQCNTEVKTMGFEQLTNAGKAGTFGQSGEPKADSGDQGYGDCVSGLVAQGVGREDAEAACRGKSTHSDMSEASATTPTEQASNKPSFIDGKTLHDLLGDDGVSLETKEAILDLEDELKSQRAFTAELHNSLKQRDAVLAQLVEERKEAEVMSEIGVLVENGYLSPAAKQAAFNHAMSLPSAASRSGFYDTFEGKSVSFGEDSHASSERSENGRKEELTAAVEMFGEDGAKMLGWTGEA